MINRNFRFSLSFKLAVIIMITSLFGISVVAYVSFLQSKEIFTQQSMSTIKDELNKFETTINDSTNLLKQNINMLAENSTTKGFLRAYYNPYHYDKVQNKTLNEFKKELKAIFILMLKQNPSYYQVRILNSKNGKELVRIESKKNGITITPEDKLQNKFSREYTQEALKKNGAIYLSNINLNREFGKIEFPIKPTLRIAKMTSSDIKKGAILIINVDASKLLNFNKSRKNKKIKTYIANQEGYYLLNTVEPIKEFGFELNNEYKILDDFPEIKTLYAARNDRFIANKNKSIIEAKKVFLESNKFIVIAKHTTDSLFDKKANEYFLKLLLYIIIAVFFIVLITIFVVKKFTEPILNLKRIANKIALTKGNEYIAINIGSKDEIGDLANSFNSMLEALIESKQEIKDFASKLEVEVNKKTRELKELNESLQKNVENKLIEIRKKDQALLQQNKTAAIGETIGAIAHQWRQPLNSLGLNIQMLTDMAEDKECSVENVEKFVEQNMKTIQFMSQTIDDFRNFFRDDREKREFDIKDAIESTIALQREQLKNSKIELVSNLRSCKIIGYRSKFMQVILNLISNAKDAVTENDNIENPYIEIRSNVKNGNIVIEVIDNGVDIPADIKQRIFEPYFTTKEQGKGTGMGLYMSKEIISSMDGEISLVSTPSEKKFVIVFKGKSE